MNRAVKLVNSLIAKPSTASHIVVGLNSIEITEASFLLQVPNFGKDKEVTLSPTAYVRNLPWTIMLKVNEAEDGTNISISVFVMCDYAMNNNWSCDTDISLNLLSSNSNKTYRMVFNHRYDRKESLKGYDPFLMWSELVDPLNGYVENNKIVIEVIMKCDEPKCVPWNSKKHTTFVGLENITGNSFLNALIQILYSIEPFRTSIIDGLSSDEHEDPKMVAFRQIFLQLSSSEVPVPIDEFIKTLGNRTRNAIKSHDSERFVNFLYKLLRKDHSTKHISDLFHGQISTLSTSAGNYEITEFEKLNGLKIKICADADIDELLNGYFTTNSCINELDSSATLIDISTMYRLFYGLIRWTNSASNNGHRTSVQYEKHIEITQLPMVLVLHLDRQQSNHFTIEQQNEIKFCMNINLSKFVKKHFDSSTKYALHAVLVRRSKTFSAFVNANNEIGWLKFDNDIISHCSEKEAIENNFRCVQMLVYTKCIPSSRDTAADENAVQFKCIICMETTTSTDTLSTICGHVFCGPCIKMEFSLRQKCPVCKNGLTEKDIHPIYL